MSNRFSKKWTTIITNGNDDQCISTTLRRQLLKMRKNYRHYQRTLSVVKNPTPLLLEHSRRRRFAYNT